MASHSLQEEGRLLLTPRECGIFKQQARRNNSNTPTIFQRKLSMYPIRHVWKLIPVLSAALLLNGCLSDDDDAASSKLGGTAATGAPIIGGTVNVKCAGGSTLSDVTDNSGVWEVTTSGQTLPCAVQVSGGNLPNGEAFHSVALQFGTVNITPLTDIVVANLAGKTPNEWFTGLNSTAFQQISSTTVNTALTHLRTALALPALDSIDPLTAKFNAVSGDKLDNALEAMKTAYTNYGALLTQAASGKDFSDYAKTYRTALTEAYAALPTTVNSGGSTTGGSTSTTCTGSSSTLTYSSSAAGGPFSNGQKVCVAASASSLTIGDKTLSNPVQNTAVQAPYAAYAFTDAAIAKYEVIFNAANLHEINVLSATGTFLGQLTGSSSSSNTNSGTSNNTSGSSGNSTLSLAVTASGISMPAITVSNVPKPSNQTEFCAALTDSNSQTSLNAALGAAGTFTINSCTFNGSVGNVAATLAITSPIAMTVPYSIVYTYN
jgi:hypothetical protein